MNYDSTASRVQHVNMRDRHFTVRVARMIVRWMDSMDGAQDLSLFRSAIQLNGLW